MSLSFTDSQLRVLSQQVLDAPQELATDNDTVAQAVEKKANLLEKDGANKVYSDNFLSILQSYSNERQYLDGTYYSQYSEGAYLIPSAREDNNSAHYPITPSVWTKLVPMLIPSMNGNPLLNNITNVESLVIPLISSAIAMLRNGFTDGSASTTLSSSYTSTVLNVNNGSPFNIGERVVVSNAAKTRSALVEVVSPAPTALLINVLEKVGPSGGTLTSGDNVRNFLPGWTNSEREAASKPYPEVFGYFASPVDSYVSTLKSSLQSQRAALVSNNAVGTDATNNTSAINSIDSAITVIDTWLAAPTSGVGVGKYGDAALGPLEAMISSRLSNVGTRVGQITSAIGGVGQAGDGSFSGSGYYFSLAKWIDLRAGKAGGSLFSYYGMDKVIDFLNTKVAKTIAKINEFDQTISVKKFAASADDTDVIDLVDTTGLLPGQSIKLVNSVDTDPIVTANIVSVTPSSVELDTTVSSTVFTLDNTARLVRLL